MRIDLDDAQYARHAMGQMAEFAQIVDQELGKAGFGKRMRDRMVLIWWSSLIGSAFSPDIANLFRLIGQEEEEE